MFPAFSSSGLNNLTKAKRLFDGATLGVVAPASPIYDPADFNKMIESLEGMGYTLKLGKHIKDRNGYLAGTDEDRVSDLHTMFEDDEVDGIICTRGGWGSNRILPLINYDLIKRNPKVFVGFSDITSLHMAIQLKSGLMTFHGPVGKSDWNDFTKQSWRQVLHEADMASYFIPEDDRDSFLVRSGVAEGKLMGGNLTVLTSLLGSTYLPDFEGAILFLEDVGEDVYRVDRMLTQLKLSGILDQLTGFVFGKCTNCDAGINSLTLMQVLDDHITPLRIPAFYGAMISHEEQNITLPVGALAKINADNKSIHLLEAGVV
ncbi:MAG: LD-carboxypeptidase [Balneolales bacterium]|nr:LD-carboxypeptidase [Balneolales bacterium]